MEGTAVFENDFQKISARPEGTQDQRKTSPAPICTSVRNGEEGSTEGKDIERIHIGRTPGDQVGRRVG